jgi:hypothetical protein
MGSNRENSLVQDMLDMHPDGFLGEKPEEGVEDDDDRLDDGLFDPGNPETDLFEREPAAETQPDGKPAEGDK